MLCEIGHFRLSSTWIITFSQIAGYYTSAFINTVLEHTKEVGIGINKDLLNKHNHTYSCTYTDTQTRIQKKLE